MLHRCNVREWEWEGMGKALWESHGNGNWLQNWEWEGMGIYCTGMGGSGNVKSHSWASLIQRHIQKHKLQQKQPKWSKQTTNRKTQGQKSESWNVACTIDVLNSVGSAFLQANGPATDNARSANLVTSYLRRIGLKRLCFLGVCPFVCLFVSLFACSADFSTRFW